MATITPAPKPTSQKPFSIAVVGGGIGGLVLAIGLLRQGVPFHVYEAAHAFSEIGAGVAFGPSSIRAMGLIDPKIKEGFKKISTGNGDAAKSNLWFTYLHGMAGPKAGDHITDLRITGDQGAVHRAHFLDELVKLVPDSCASFGKRLDALEELPDSVLLKFHDGTTATASAVVGCDGVKSRVRTVLLGDKDPSAHAEFSGKYAYRGLVPMDKAATVLGDDLARNGHMHLGYGGHVLTMPIEHGTTMNVVAFRSKPDGWHDERWVTPMRHEDLESDFEGYDKHVRKVLTLMEKPDVWALFQHPPAKTYTRGRICLLGDAAHASTPHQGSGAGMAIEDGYLLSSLLGTVATSSGIEPAFKAYDAVRRPRTQKLVTTSQDVGFIYGYEDKETGDDAKKIEENLQKRMLWIWNEDLEKEFRTAKGMMEA